MFLSRSSSVNTMGSPLPEPDLNRDLIVEERRIIARLYIFLGKEYRYVQSLNPNGDLTPLSNILRRTAEATGVTEKKVLQCVQEFAEEFTDQIVYEPPKMRFKHNVLR
ncbi:uncharacterized protein LOC123876166 [Maniola jurtina]|uniref:uncharacterized protein LOC123876166 n=1 Tax=Maniola jurtina TaxID=191418 RepID=UPI001E68DA94|nr:uncharacterized protein LOC123876166 [Maniola jurtina]